jgi:hypothetical protein
MISNCQPRKEMQTANDSLATVFAMEQAFRKIQGELHIIGNYQPIKGMLLVNDAMVCAFGMELGFRKI